MSTRSFRFSGSALLALVAACGEPASTPVTGPSATGGPPGTAASSVYAPATVTLSGSVSGTFVGRVGLLDDGVPHPLFDLQCDGEPSLRSVFSILPMPPSPGSYGVTAATVRRGPDTWTLGAQGGTLILTAVGPERGHSDAPGWQIHGALVADLEGPDGSAVSVHASF